MNTYTVALFSHREPSNQYMIEEKNKSILRDLITNKEYIEFLVGRDRNFNKVAAFAVRETVKHYGCGNTSLVLVLSYERAEYRDNMDNYLVYYDEVEICSESAYADFNAAITIRYKTMVDRSDFVPCTVERNRGGAWATVNYAKKQGKHIINLSEEGGDI